MWIFIVTDALLFAGLLVAYGVVRVASPTWPEQSQAFDMNYITLMTFTLITSSATMACAVAAAMVGNKKHVTTFLWATILGGFAFLGHAGLRVVPFHPRGRAAHRATPGVSPSSAPRSSSSPVFTECT